jgi:molecular chaperone DnaK (HSP70)
MPGTLAIDLGSSTTVVAWQEAGAPPRLLELPPYSGSNPTTIPSLLWLSHPQQRRPLIGRQVLDAGLADQPGPGLLRDFKRLIGQSAASAGPRPERQQPGGMRDSPWLDPEAAGALLLRCVWEALPAELSPDRLVLTAPIETYRGYRQWLERVSRELPVAEVALVDEPTAAAIGAGLPPGSRVLVVDGGGGTFDLSLVALEGGEGRAAPIAQLLRFAGRDLGASGQALRTARVIGKAGVALGGRDLDRWIAAHLCPDVAPDPALLTVAEAIKCRLSESEEALGLWVDPAGTTRELRLDRPRLEKLLVEQGLVAQLDALLDSVLAAARSEALAGPAIAAVLTVGGCSQLPLLRRWLQERLPEVPLQGDRPIEAVAMGALALTPGVTLRDVLARGVSLRCWDQRSGQHRWHPLFVAGQAWPTEQPLEVVLACSQDEQRELELVLGEPLPQERSEVMFVDGLPVLNQRRAGQPRVETWPTATPTLPLASPGRRGEDCMRLRFQIDASGQLLLEAQDLSSAQPLGTLSLGPVR